MARYKIRKCPGCDRPYEMPANSICNDCKIALRQHQRLQAQIRQATDLQVVRFGTGWNYEGKYTSRWELCSAINDAIVGILAAPNLRGMVTTNRSFYLSSSERQQYSPDCYQIPEHIADHVEQLLGLLIELMNGAYDTGFRKGRGLLMGLATGDLSIQDYEERVK